jgi:hypothetical protein
MTTLKLALRKLSLGVLLLQWIGNVAVILLAIAWLQVPDSYVWQFIFSVVAGLLLLFSFLWLHARTFRMLHASTETASLGSRLLVLLITIVVGYLLLLAISAGRDYESLFAGYWNSKFSAGTRTFFTYPRLVQWQEYLYNLLQWLFAAILLPVAFIGASTGLRGGWKQIRGVYKRLSYWIVAILSGLIGYYLSSALTSWIPDHGTAGEILSVILRFGLAYTIDILLWCFVLALVAVHAAKQNVSESVPIP